MQKLCDLLGSLGNTLDLVEVLSTLDRELRRLVYYDAISVHLVEGARLVPAYGLASSEDLDLLMRVAVGRQPAVNELCRKPDSLEFALVFPVEAAAEAIGVLALYRRHSQRFSDDDVELLRVSSVKLSSAILNARKFQQAADSAAADPVTGLANVRWLFQHLDAELSRARRAETGLAVLQCSIAGWDGDAGREAFEKRTFEQALVRIRESCRDYDFSARIGDDLVLVLPGFGPADLAEKCELIERIVEETGLCAGLPLMATLGAAFYPEEGRDARDLLALSARRLDVARQFSAGVEEIAELS